MKTLIIILLGAIFLCVTACSDEFELGYRVVQMEDDSYVLQYAHTYGPYYNDDPEWRNLYHMEKVQVGLDRYWDFPGDIARYTTKEKACMECNELIQGKLKKENPFKVRRPVNCNK